MIKEGKVKNGFDEYGVKADNILPLKREYMSLAVELAQLGPWKYNPAAKLFEFGDEFYNIYGTSLAREGRFMAAETYVREFVHPDDAGLVQTALDKALASPERNYSYQTEFRIIRRDGVIRTVVALANVIKDENGAIVSYYGADQDITERMVAEEKIKRQNGYLMSLHEISIGLLNRLNIDDLLATLLNHACSLLGSPDAFITLVNEDNGMLEFKVGTGRFFSHNDTFSRGEGLIGKVWQNGVPLVISDYSNWAGRKKNSFYNNTKTCIGIPIKTDKKIIGVIGLGYLDEPHAASQEEIFLFSRLAELASIAIDNARLYSTLQRELEGRRRALIDLKASEEKFFKAFRHVGDVVAIIRLSDGRHIEVNDAFVKLLGYSREESIERTAGEFGLWADETEYQKFFALTRSAGAVYKLEADFIAKSGEKKTGLISAEVIEIGGESCLVYIWQDITERKQAEGKLRYLSRHDPLTGLYNRAYFGEALKSFQEENRNPVGVIMLDVDGLKLINDTLGHTAGDKLLVAAAQLIRRGIGPDDIPARIGGDEFAVIMPGASGRSAQKTVDRISCEIAAYNQGKPDIPVNLSLGYAIKPNNYASMQELVRDADNNMYKEKLLHTQNARSTIVNTIVRLMEDKDTERQQNLAARLALAIGLSPASIADVRLLAKYHDIGEVGIRDSVLRKAGPLTEEERRKVRRHCEIGYRLAQTSTKLLPIAPLILKHQEWWNGEGYPLGISGEEIPLECRIIAIVDAYDALTGCRPYGESLSREAAFRELGRRAGTQFDPDLVEKFCKIDF